MKRLLVWGAGDQDTVTLDRALVMKRYDGTDFLDVEERGRRSIPGYVAYEEGKMNLSGFLRSYNGAIVAIGSNDLREVRTSRLMSPDISLATVIYPTAAISSFSHIPRGCVVLARAVVNPSAYAGIGRTVSTGTTTGHGYIVGDLADICPGVPMVGHTRVGRKSFLGIGSTITDDITVGEGFVMGAGAVVIRNVPDRVVMAGVPAKGIHS